MKITLAVATVAAVVGAVAGADAADLYKGGSLKDAPALLPPSTWTGCYIGGYAGGAFLDKDVLSRRVDVLNSNHPTFT